MEMFIPETPAFTPEVPVFSIDDSDNRLGARKLFREIGPEEAVAVRFGYDDIGSLADLRLFGQELSDEQVHDFRLLATSALLYLSGRTAVEVNNQHSALNVPVYRARFNHGSQLGNVQLSVSRQPFTVNAAMPTRTFNALPSVRKVTTFPGNQHTVEGNFVIPS